MLNYQNIHFSEILSQNRINIAYNTFGQTIIKRVLCFAFFLLGASRSSIAEYLNIPVDTVKSFLKRIFKKGLNALEDGRHKSSSFLPIRQESVFKTSLSVQEDLIVIDINNKKIQIPRKNIFQSRVVLLTLLNNKLLTTGEVSEALDFSTSHIQKLNKNLQEGDVYFLLDNRRGQQQEYRFSPEVKSELIQQFVFDIVTEGTTSGERLGFELKERCNFHLSARSIRYHINKLGLNRLKKSLPVLIESFKKNSERL